MSQPVQITAIVCTHNRANYLQKCLGSLFNQNLDPCDYEILVIDNGSTDNTRDICLQYEGRENFRYIYEPVLGLSQARNTGWKQAKGKYIGYIDDDAEANCHWLAKALESFKMTPEPDWVGGSVTLAWEVEPPDWLTEAYYSALGWVNWGNVPRYLDSDSEWLVGCNSLFKKESLSNIGGFDVRLGRKEKLLLSGEEVQVHHKLKAGGGTFFYHPEVHVHHHVVRERITPNYFYRRYYWGGITDYIMSKTLEGIPSQIVTEDRNGDSRLTRLVRNFFGSLGLFSSQVKTVQARIYMSYVAGQIMAILSYSWRLKDSST